MINKIRAHVKELIRFICSELVAQTTYVQLPPRQHAAILACPKRRHKRTLNNKSGLIFVSYKAPALLPFVLVHFFLAFLDDAGHMKLRCIG